MFRFANYTNTISQIYTEWSRKGNTSLDGHTVEQVCATALQICTQEGPDTNGVLLVLLPALRVSNGMQQLIAYSSKKCFKDMCTIGGHGKWVTSEKDPRVSPGPMNSHGGRQRTLLNYFTVLASIATNVWYCAIYIIHSFSSLSCDRSKASSKASSPHSAIQSFLFQMRVSSPFLKVIQ